MWPVGRIEGGQCDWSGTGEWWQWRLKTVRGQIIRGVRGGGRGKGLLEVVTWGERAGH